MEKYILSYYFKDEYALYGDASIIMQVIETNDLPVMVEMFLNIVANLRCVPVAAVVLQSIECIVHSEKVDRQGMPVEQDDAQSSRLYEER